MELAAQKATTKEIKKVDGNTNHDNSAESNVSWIDISTNIP